MLIHALVIIRTHAHVLVHTRASTCSHTFPGRNKTIYGTIFVNLTYTYKIK